MKAETKDLLKETLVRKNEVSQKIKQKIEVSWFKKTMIKFYLALPYKTQYYLAKLGVKMAMKKKLEQIKSPS